MPSTKLKAEKTKELFQLYRGLILDACEREVDVETTWTYLRNRLLKLLSPERGLESKILETWLEGENDEHID